MPTSKLTKRAVDALVPPAKKQTVLWDTELKGFGVRVLPSGLKTFIVQYRNAEGIKRRINIARYGVLTVDQARDQAKLKLAAVIGGEDPADEVRQARKGMAVEEMCDWYLTEARAGNILGRKNLPIKKSSLDMDESRIKTHIKPLLGKRIVKHLTIADVEQMQTDVKDGKTAKPRSGGRGGMATGGAGVAARCVGTLQAIIGHAKHKGLLDAHPTQGAKKLAGKKKTRRLSVAEIVLMGKAMAYAERNGENPVALGVLRTLLLTGYRREEGQAMHRAWVNGAGGYVAFPDTKGGAQIRAIGPAAVKAVESQPVIVGNPHAFPSEVGRGAFTAVSACLQRVAKLAGIEGITPHTLRHTFGSVAGDLGFSELTIRAMLGHASQNVTQDYIHIDEALKLAVRRTSDEIERLLAEGAAKLETLRLAA
ncbi:phage integrase family protein [Sphingomonas sp. S17]|uniref:tyrosine-type recombinase/integrase n=1 Tax=Sphingomonadales TaxID=204457 RepID=UPI00020A2A70|nr:MULTISPECIES: integrase family protein [Sphingomonadaceae]AVA14985.1 integrase [Sphingopyxis sp. MG]EGI54386.1 phage integrase family protein [Sphingomonas sp. S17]